MSMTARDRHPYNTSERYASELLDFLKDSTLPESEPLKPFDNQVPLGW